MGDTTAIAWTDHTFNIAWGCTKVSPGCSSCYAETLSAKYSGTVWGPKGTRRTFGPDHWKKPLLWNRKARAAGERRRVFSSSMCDIFEDHPTITAELVKLWDLIRATPWLDWQLLTKRATRIAANLPPDWGQGWPNVWLGVSVENQEYAAERIPALLQVAAAVHFVSYEPALEAVDFRPYLPGSDSPARSLDRDIHPRPEGRDLDWIICGGESGPGFRPMDHAWARAVRDQCRAAGVAFFFKQSAAHRTELGIKLDGEIIREYPRPRRMPR